MLFTIGGDLPNLIAVLEISAITLRICSEDARSGRKTAASLAKKKGKGLFPRLLRHQDDSPTYGRLVRITAGGEFCAHRLKAGQFASLSFREKRGIS